MTTKVFQRGNFVIVEQNTKENPIPIDNFDYDFVTPDSVKLKDVVESTELNAATADLQKENGDPINTELLAKEHFATFVKSSSGGGGGGGNVVVTNNPDPSTATHQAQQTANLATSNTNEALIIIEELKQTAELEDIKENERRKSIGKLIDLSADLNGDWGGFPVQAASITLVVNGDNVDFQMDDVESENNKDLVQQLNNVQSLVVFDWVDGTDKIVFNGVSVSSVEVSGLLIQDNNVGPLGYANFIDSVDQETGAVQQLAVLAQEQVSLTKDLLRNDPVIESAISLSYGGDTAINPTVTPDKDGKLIPLDRFGDVTIFATNNNVSYRFDGGTDFTPVRSYPRTRSNFSTELKNVNLNLFIMIGEANNSRWAISVNLIKK